jgi:N-acetylmuramoyl-L-alanine amidase
MNLLKVLFNIFILPFTLLGQITGLAGWDICVDPGHSRTENMGIYDYSEAEKNVRVALRLKEMLLNETDIDTVYLTRSNDQQSVGLSERSEYANQIGASWFHSIHSNAGAPGSNSTLLLWGQYNTGVEKVPNGGKAMSDIIIPLLTQGLRTTTAGSRGDCSFYGCGSWRGPYLSVNRNTLMPSELSEAGYHTNPTQNQLNMNDDWKRLEARTFFWSILDYHNIPRPPVSILTGIIKDADSGLPINGAEITVNDSLYITDTYESLFYKYSTDPDLLRNGFYYFEDVVGDTFDIYVSAAGFYRDTVSVARVNDFFTFQDVELVSTDLPIVEYTFPSNGDTTFSVLDEIVIDFNRPMNRASVESTLVIDPEIEVAFSWLENDGRLLLISDSLKFLTYYSVTISGKSVDNFDHPLDGNKDGTGGDDYTFSFRTGNDMEPPVIVESYPSDSQEGIELKPIISLTYDEELDPTTITEEIIKIQRDANDRYVDLDLAHYVVNDQSVLNLFPRENLYDGERYLIDISSGIKDLLGNTVTYANYIPFITGFETIEITSIDNFESGVDHWWQPSQSGQTTGIGAGTLRSANQNFVNLLSSSTQSLELDYEWDVNASSWFIRLYLGGGAPRSVVFDTSYVLQSYVFGDGSGNSLRFCVDDRLPNENASYHEVSLWYTIDWIGWKLLEWDLSDPDQVGSWLGDRKLDGNLRFDSFQFTHAEGMESQSSIYFDDLRVVKKYSVLKIESESNQIPTEYSLSQNYPNPFNPITHIKFSLIETDFTTLNIYDVVGRKVQTLVNERLSPGEYEVLFDAATLASGTYIYVLTSGSQTMKKKMILLK